MNAMLVALAITLSLSLLIQFLLVAGFVLRLQRWKIELLADAVCPEAVVILCLRGGDPFLSKCIDGLVTQNYPNYRVCFMLDHQSDPALQILHSALGRHTFSKYKIEYLDRPAGTCSLKCSSLVQAVTSLDASVVFIALLDADTIPHPNWLRELATALQPATVGAATGNRWYMPAEFSQGALIRYVWNAAAVVQMYWYRIAWGGTLAIKLESIRQAGLLERWSKSLCEDTMLRRQLGNIGQRVGFVPALMMINREDCTVDSYVRWVKRQLLTAKLYHPLWIGVVGHGISSALFLLWGWITCLALLLQGDWSRGLGVCLGMFIFQACLTLMLPWLESAVRPIVRSRGEATDWYRGLSWVQFCWSVWATQWVYTWALLSCLFMRRVEWRGVEYDISGPWNIRLLGYRPFHSGEPEKNVSTHSL